MKRLTIGKADFSTPCVDPTNHWCVCSGKVVIGGLFDTKDEAVSFARESGKEDLSIHHVGAAPNVTKEQAYAIAGYTLVGPC